MKKYLLLFAAAIALGVAGCQTPGGPPGMNDVASLIAPCDKPKITEHCAKVTVVKDSAGKNHITVNPDPIVLTGHRNFHWILWAIDDAQSTAPGKYTFGSVGITTSSAQLYSCYRPVWVQNRYYVCWDYNNNADPITYQVQLLDGAGNPAPIDPQIFNDG